MRLKSPAVPRVSKQNCLNNQSFRQLLKMPKYGKICGAIRWYSRLPKLQKPIFASIYSRLLNWVNAVHRGSGGRYSRYFADGFALRRCRNSIRRYSAAPKCEFRSQFPLLPLYSANGFRRQVVADAADAGNFGGHNINGADAANDAGRLLGSMQSSFEFGWNASLLARRIFHIYYLYPVGNFFP